MLSSGGPSSAVVGRPSSSEVMVHGLANSISFPPHKWQKWDPYLRCGSLALAPSKNRSSHDICSLRLEAIVGHILCLCPSQPFWRAAQPRVRVQGRGLLAVHIKMEQTVSLKLFPHVCPWEALAPQPGADLMNPQWLQGSSGPWLSVAYLF